jgi:hypothetical protein
MLSELERPETCELGRKLAGGVLARGAAALGAGERWGGLVRARCLEAGQWPRRWLGGGVRLGVGRCGAGPGASWGLGHGERERAGAVL